MIWWRVFAAVLAAILTVGLAVGASVPAELIRPYVPGEGQLHHFVGVLGIAFLLTASCPWAWKWIFGIGLMTSAAVELVQPFLGRGAQWIDFAANVAGLFVGVAAALPLAGGVRRRLPRGR